jgi:hypothetical protein
MKHRTRHLLRTLSATVTLAVSVAACALFASPAQAGTVAVNVAGASSIDLLGTPGNTVWFVSLGAGETLTSLDWDVNLNAAAPSVLSDMQVSFGASDGLDMLTLAPGFADAFSGSGSYTGSLDLSAYGLILGADGLLRIEFSEAFKDGLAGVSEGLWTAGTLGFSSASAGALPEPGTVGLVLVGLAGLVGGRRARRG